MQGSPSQNGLTTTSTTIAAKISTAASLKKRNQRSRRRFSICSKLRSRLRQLFLFCVYYIHDVNNRDIQNT